MFYVRRFEDDFSQHIELPEWLSLTVIAAALGAGILASILVKPKEKPASVPEPEHENVE